jgi:hypothetical protein
MTPLQEVTLRRLQGQFESEVKQGHRVGALIVYYPMPAPAIDIMQIVNVAGNLPPITNPTAEFLEGRLGGSTRLEKDRTHGSTLWLLGDANSLQQFDMLTADGCRALSIGRKSDLIFEWTRLLFVLGWRKIPGSPLWIDKWTVNGGLRIGRPDRLLSADSGMDRFYQCIYDGAEPFTASALPDLFAASSAAIDLFLTGAVDPPPILILPGEERSKNAEAEQESKLKVFSGGAMVFYANHVELCGTTICGGPRCEQARKTLDLLRQKNIKGDFRAFGSKNLAEMIGREGGSLSVPGLIRDIRMRISEELRSIEIQCGRHDVIVRTKQGYQFKDFITVHDADESTDIGIQGHDLPKAGHNVPYHDDPDVPNDPNSDDPNVPDDKAEARGNWVLQELGKGRELRAPDIVQEFGCSLKTAKRDLKSLKDDEAIEFVGSPRTGHYRLKIVTNPR